MTESVYLVGGAVRDRLLGRPVREKDWVVVGSTAQSLLEQGFRQVGKAFPVFLHPETGEEYALARTETKAAPGHTGFHCDSNPNVTLEEDLLRRDLTINAIAETPSGEIIDPYHGQDDLAERRLRHVSSAFSEDPLRVLRVARFMAELASFDFHIAPETMALMQHIAAQNELETLPKERIWQECEKALKSPKPVAFFQTLQETHCLTLWFSQLTEDAFTQLEQATQQTQDPSIRFAVLLHKAQHHLSLPRAYQQLITLVQQHTQQIPTLSQQTLEQRLDWIKQLDAMRRFKRFQKFATAMQILHPQHQKTLQHVAQQIDNLMQINTQKLITPNMPPASIQKKIRAAQLSALQ